MIFLMGLAVASYGEVRVNWMGSLGFYFTEDPSVGILGNATGNSTFAQLVFSVDLYADAVGVGGVATGNDVVWDTITLTEGVNTTGWSDFGSKMYTQAFVQGYVYARIFQDSGAEAGDWYFYTPMETLRDVTGMDFNQSLELNTDFVNGNAIDSGPTVAQVVPEPAAIGLIGLGGIITLTASRIRRRNNR